MADYIQVKPGTDFPTLTLSVTGISGDLAVPSLQNVTLNNAVDVFSWTQMNEPGKLQVPTTATNSISTTLVVEELTFFGNAGATAGSAEKLGLLGLSDARTLCNVSLTMGTKTITCEGYVTGLAPTVSADSPVWTTPVTVTVTGGYTFA